MTKEETISSKDIALRAIQAYLTSDKKVNRQLKAEQILKALECIGYHEHQERNKGGGAISLETDNGNSRR